MPFWRVIRPTNRTYGTAGSTPCRSSASVASCGAVLVGVDPVVDDRDPLLGDVEVGEDVVLRALRHRDDGVGHLERRPLDPRRRVVAAAELLPFPRAERLQRVDGDHERDAVGELGEDPAEVGVPRVAVDDVGGDRLGNEPDRPAERSEHGPQLLRGSRQVVGDREAADPQRALAHVLLAEGPARRRR